MAAQSQEVVEQQFILRVQDPELADTLRAWLREDVQLAEKPELLFEDLQHERRGKLVVNGQTYPVLLQDLPALVESYKTLDDANLIKTADVGQVLVVGPADTGHVAPDAAHRDIIDVTGDAEAAGAGPLALGQPEQPADPMEATDGVTPFMRMARKRNFRPAFTISPAQVQQVENMVLDIVSGRAPEGWTFQDVEEEFVVNEHGEGRWQPVSSKVGGKRAVPTKKERKEVAGSDTE